MINLTPIAAEKVLKIRAEEKMNDNQFLRATLSGGGCSGFSFDLFFDETKEDDLHFESLGVNIIVNQVAMTYLEGTTIDYIEDGLMGTGFKFNNPGISSKCGCGKSVSFD